MTDKLGELVRNYWPGFAAIVVAAIAWGSLTMQVQAIAEAQRLMSAKLDRIAEGLASAQTTALYNSTDIADLKHRVHELETARR